MTWPPPFRGRPRERSVDSKPHFLAACATHAGEPNGTPRVTLFRSDSNSPAVIGLPTNASQSFGRGTGPGSIQVGRTASGVQSLALDQGQLAADRTSLARSGLRSAYRNTVNGED